MLPDSTLVLDLVMSEVKVTVEVQVEVVFWYAVVEDFITAVRGGEAVWGEHDGSLALYRAQIIDACYQSALEQREVRL